MYICIGNEAKQKTKTMRTLTTEYTKRTETALNDTRKSLDKAMRYSEDLRDMDLIAGYEKHILKLENMLITKQW